MDNIRRKKWLGIAERFPKMTTDEQSRVQERMREWASLTPEKRAKVRDGYKEFQQLPPEKKLAVKQKWDNYYSSLPDEEKQRIREGGQIARPTTPTVAGQPPSTAAVADAKAGSDSPDATKR